MEDKAVLPECVWSGLRDPAKIASNVGYRCLSALAARYNDKVSSSGSRKDRLPRSNNSWQVAGSLDLTKRGRLSSE